jgi:hypothetical protein
MEIGPEPPPPPRRLPPGFATRQRITGNVVSIIGLAFTGVGCVMLLAMIAAPGWALCIPGVLLFVGVSILNRGIQTANQMLDAFRNGRAVRGKAASVRQDPHTTVNGRHPWEISYSFEAEGHPYEGKVTTYETATANRFYGSPPVWVLVVENRPERNTLYPPIR